MDDQPTSSQKGSAKEGLGILGGLIFTLIIVGVRTMIANMSATQTPDNSTESAEDIARDHRAATEKRQQAEQPNSILDALKKRLGDAATTQRGQ